MTYTYKTHGTCSTEIELILEGDVLRKVSFKNGCDGNLQGIEKLVEGMTLDMVVDKLSGIHCGKNVTSCPDQLAKAVEAVRSQIS